MIIDGKMRLTYNKLLIAVGARATPLEVPGSELDGVVKLDHLNDAKNIIKHARKGKTAIVVGGELLHLN